MKRRLTKHGRSQPLHRRSHGTYVPRFWLGRLPLDERTFILKRWTCLAQLILEEAFLDIILLILLCHLGLWWLSLLGLIYLILIQENDIWSISILWILIKVVVNKPYLTISLYISVVLHVSAVYIWIAFGLEFLSYIVQLNGIDVLDASICVTYQLQKFVAGHRRIHHIAVRMLPLWFFGIVAGRRHLRQLLRCASIIQGAAALLNRCEVTITLVQLILILPILSTHRRTDTNRRSLSPCIICLYRRGGPHHILLLLSPPLDGESTLGRTVCLTLR